MTSNKKTTNDWIIIIMNTIIILMFVYMLITRSFLEQRIVIYTADGELLWMEDYMKELTNQPQFLTDKVLSSGKYNFSNYNGSMMMFDTSNYTGAIE